MALPLKAITCESPTQLTVNSAVTSPPSGTWMSSGFGDWTMQLAATPPSVTLCGPNGTWSRSAMPFATRVAGDAPSSETVYPSGPVGVPDVVTRTWIEPVGETQVITKLTVLSAPAVTTTGRGLSPPTEQLGRRRLM